MPALPELADVLIGLALLLVVGAVWLAYLVANELSSHVSIFGWHPFGIVANWLHDAVNWLWSVEMDTVHSIIALLEWMVHAPVAVLNSLINVADVLDGHVNWIATTQVPEAQATAEHYAQYIVAASNASTAGELHQLSADLKVESDAREALSSFLIHREAPALRTYAAERAFAALAAAESNATGLVNNLRNETNQELANAWAVIGGLQHSVSSTLPHEISQAAAQERAAIAADHQSTMAALQAQIGVVDQKIAAAVAAGNQALLEQATAEHQQLTAAVATLDGAIAIDNQQIGALDEATQVTIPLAIAGIAAAVASITTEIEDCMVSACDGSPNNLLNLLQKLMGAFSIVGELGFIAAAIRDPVGTEQAIAGTLDGIYTAGHDALDALLSL